MGKYITLNEKPQPKSGGTGGWGFHRRDGGVTKPSRYAVPAIVCFRCCLSREADAGRAYDAALLHRRLQIV
jgi:hypothetical protein